MQNYQPHDKKSKRREDNGFLVVSGSIDVATNCTTNVVKYDEDQQQNMRDIHCESIKHRIAVPFNLIIIMKVFFLAMPIWKIVKPWNFYIFMKYSSYHITQATCRNLNKTNNFY